MLFVSFCSCSDALLKQLGIDFSYCHDCTCTTRAGLDERQFATDIFARHFRQFFKASSVIERRATFDNDTLIRYYLSLYSIFLRHVQK